MALAASGYQWLDCRHEWGRLQTPSLMSEDRDQDLVYGLDPRRLSDVK